MNILIVGGSGFIGYHLTKRIHDLKYNYLSTYRTKKPNKLNFFRLNLNKFESKRSIISRFKPNVVIYLAWNGIPNYSKKNSEYNLCISKKFIDFISKLDSLKRIIISGSCFEKKKDINLKFFVKAKLELKNYIYKKFKNKKIKQIWVRIFYVYGEGQRKLSLIPTLIRKLKRGIDPEIKNLNSSNDFVYIKDVVDFFIKCIKLKTKKNILDCGYGKLYSVNEICLITEKLILKKNKLFKISNQRPIKKGIKASTYNWFKPNYKPKRAIKEML